VCGICGIAHTDPARSVDKTVLIRMNTAMTHRGPDEEGYYCRGAVGLAMRRLSILDIPGGRQPMTNENGSVTVVFNGEVYNFRELRAQLEARGHVFRSHGDTEVIVHAYEEYGDAALDRLNGMFAFALHDAGRERLLLARDRLGIKPLFYCFRDGMFAFASELDPLLRAGMVRGALDPAALDAYFTFLYIPSPDTIFQDARKLRPGEKLVFEKGCLTTESYWRLRFSPEESWTLDSAAAAYRDLLNDAVRLQSVSDVPLGAFLSGGVDSSSVVGVLSAHSPRPVKTFTIGFDDAHMDEMRFARIAARHFGTDHTEELLTPDVAVMAEQLVPHFGEPFADSSAAPTWLVSKLARQHVTVALSGDGGDELFAGYTWLHRTRNVAAYRRVPESLRRLADAVLHIAPASPAAAKLRRFSKDSFLSPMEAFRRRETCFSEDLRAELYRPETARAVAGAAMDRFAEHAEMTRGLSDEDRMLYQDAVMYLPGDILAKVDRMSMAHSLEARVPLLDHRLVEFAATLPFRLKHSGGTSKYVAKHALRDLLPQELLVQRKQGFAVPIHRWFREVLRKPFADTVLCEDAWCGRFLNRKTIRHVFDAHVDGKENYGHHLWCLWMFEHWLRYAAPWVDVHVPGQ